jgi:hypothetical protein
MIGLEVESVGVINLTKDQDFRSAIADATNVLAQRAVVGDENGYDYVLTNFAPALDVRRSAGHPERIFHQVTCRVRIPELGIVRDVKVAIDMQPGEPSGRAVLPTYSFPLGRVQPQQATFHAEFLDGEQLIAEKTVPVRFTNTPCW